MCGRYSLSPQESQEIMDILRQEPDNLAARARSEKYAKILSKAIINPEWESFASQKSAIFLILPEEDTTKNFMAGLMIQTLSRELFSVANEHDGKLQNRVVFFCDELGTMPAFDILPLFSAGRSRRLTLVPIIQSLAQLEKNYGKEGAEIIQDNV